jgi:hypothetical protein
MKTFRNFLKVDKKQPQEFVSSAGAGEWGRSELRDKYLSDTPGQSIQLYKKFTKPWHIQKKS